MGGGEVGGLWGGGGVSHAAGEAQKSLGWF